MLLVWVWPKVITLSVVYNNALSKRSSLFATMSKCHKLICFTFKTTIGSETLMRIKTISLDMDGSFFQAKNLNFKTSTFSETPSLKPTISAVKDEYKLG